MLNKVQLIGNLGNDPDIKTMSSGDKVANFSVATSERWTEKSSGEKKEKTQWHRITVWNQGLVNIVEKYLKKGSKVYVEGQLETRKYTDSAGVEKYSTEVVIKNYRGELTMLDKAANNADSNQSYGASTIGEQDQIDDKKADKKAAIVEDEIPF